MKKLLIILAAAVVAIVISGGCRKRPINGDLDGMWQIMTVEYPSKPTLVPDQYYLCLYRHTANLRHTGGFTIGGNMVYDEEANSLSVEFPYPGTWLGDVGVNGHTPYTFRFKILRLTGKQLVMSLNDTITYTLRKF